MLNHLCVILYDTNSIVEDDIIFLNINQNYILHFNEFWVHRTIQSFCHIYLVFTSYLTSYYLQFLMKWTISLFNNRRNIFSCHIFVEHISENNMKKYCERMLNEKYYKNYSSTDLILNLFTYYNAQKIIMSQHVLCLFI